MSSPTNPHPLPYSLSSPKSLLHSNELDLNVTTGNQTRSISVVVIFINVGVDVFQYRHERFGDTSSIGARQICDPQMSLPPTTSMAFGDWRGMAVLLVVVGVLLHGGGNNSTHGMVDVGEA
ncbi:hypothetical protein GYH30_051812 [Glycine max]|nr:hypothetical protein GYH30_051812 [Glycine max]